MAHSLSLHFNNLKQALLLLKPTGENGFEGLMAVVLSEIIGVPFRLAGSGRQFGIDGKSTYDNDAICFECKRYEDDIPRNEVITKIADLARNDSSPDLVWVLGATSRLKTQLANEVRVDGRKAGISVLILDWSNSDLPPLAVALAMGGQEVEGFLEDNISNKLALQKALTEVAQFH